MRFDYNAFLALFDDDAEGAIVTISASTIALCNCLNSSITSSDFRDGDTLLTSEQADEIDAIIALMFDEINPIPEPETVTIFEGVDPVTYDTVGGDPVNLGMRIQSSVSGNVIGLRFWRWEFATPSQTGHLWTNAGSLLGSVDYPDAGFGWIEADFDEPIAIDADTTYVISLHTESGEFVRTFGVMSSEISNPPLTLIADGVDGYSGSYEYNASPVFPNNNAFAQNYWLDVKVAPNA